MHLVWQRAIFPGVADGKESACNEGDPGSIPGLGTSNRKWQPTPVSLSAEFHGRRSWAGYSPWDHRVGNDCATQQQQQQTSLCHRTKVENAIVQLNYMITL